MTIFKNRFLFLIFVGFIDSDFKWITKMCVMLFFVWKQSTRMGAKSYYKNVPICKIKKMLQKKLHGRHSVKCSKLFCYIFRVKTEAIMVQSRFNWQCIQSFCNLKNQTEHYVKTHHRHCCLYDYNVLKAILWVRYWIYNDVVIRSLFFAERRTSWRGSVMTFSEIIIFSQKGIDI